MARIYTNFRGRFNSSHEDSKTRSFTENIKEILVEFGVIVALWQKIEL